MYLYVGGNLGIGMMIIIKIIIITILLLCRSFFFLKAATQLAHQVHQERTQVVCSNKVSRSRLARRHSRNGRRTYEY